MNEVERLFTRWLDRTAEIHLQEIGRLEIGDTGDLEKSVKTYYRHLAAGYLEGGLEFNDSGRYVDMGSGRGFSHGKRDRSSFDSEGERRSGGRKKKPWYSRVWYARVNDLQGAVGFQLMEQAVQMGKVIAGD